MRLLLIINPTTAMFFLQMISFCKNNHFKLVKVNGDGLICVTTPHNLLDLSSSVILV